MVSVLLNPFIFANKNCFFPLFSFFKNIYIYIYIMNNLYLDDFKAIILKNIDIEDMDAITTFVCLCIILIKEIEMLT